MKLFSGRTAELKTMNRILTDAARKRGQRVEELELELGRVKSEYALRVQRVEELERKLQHHERGEVEAQKLERELTEAATKRALRVQELEQELTEAATKRALRVQELEQELLAARTEIATIDYPRLEAERAFYRKRADELEEHNRQLTEAATQCSLRVQELEQELLAARTEIATIDCPRLEAERAFYRKRADELEEHNRQLTEAATKYSLRVQKLERELRAVRPEIATND